jgi:hypothetical protein
MISSRFPLIFLFSILMTAAGHGTTTYVIKSPDKSKLGVPLSPDKLRIVVEGMGTAEKSNMQRRLSLNAAMVVAQHALLEAVKGGKFELDTRKEAGIGLSSTVDGIVEHVKVLFKKYIPEKEIAIVTLEAIVPKTRYQGYEFRKAAGTASLSAQTNIAVEGQRICNARNVAMSHAMAEAIRKAYLVKFKVAQVPETTLKGSYFNLGTVSETIKGDTYHLEAKFMIKFE